MNRRSWLTRILVATGLAAAVVILVIWRQEQGLGEIEQRLAAGDVEGALVAVDAFLEMHPGDGPATALRARSLVAAGRPAEAAQLFEQAGAARLEDLRSWSSALLALGQWEPALPILERLAQLEPANPETIEAMTVCCFELDRRAAAVAFARRLAAIPGQQARGHLQLASIYREWGYPFEANEHYAHVLRHEVNAEGINIAPHEFFLDYGDSLLAAGSARRAVEMLQRSNELEPSLDAVLRLGQAWKLIGDNDQAREFLQQVLHQDPRSQIAREQLAEIELQQGNLEAAMQLLEPLVEHDSLNANTSYLLQRAYSELGDEPRARDWAIRTTALRTTQRRLAALQTRAASQRLVALGDLVRAYQAAYRRDWESAGKTLASLLRRTPDTYNERFVQQLVAAIREQSSDQLPSLESLPDSLLRSATTSSTR